MPGIQEPSLALSETLLHGRELVKCKKVFMSVISELSGDIGK